MLSAGIVVNPAQVLRIGALASSAIQNTGLHLRRLPNYARSSYWLAGDTIVWAGSRHCSMHPRAIVLQHDAASDECLTLAQPIPAPWQPPGWLPAEIQKDAIDETMLCARLLGEPRGFSAFLLGRPPELLLSYALPAAERFARACARDDGRSALREASFLLGLGSGLTPSGDDFVGAAVFTRRRIAAGSGAQAAWAAAASAFTELARQRTHSISAALFEDLVGGNGYEALHQWVDSLTRPRSRRNMRARIESLTCIGHSSGWDLLAGCLAALRGRLTPVH